jgi:hypothetical protein
MGAGLGAVTGKIAKSGLKASLSKEGEHELQQALRGGPDPAAARV